jgi:hypothetical protein
VGSTTFGANFSQGMRCLVNRSICCYLLLGSAAVCGSFGSEYDAAGRTENSVKAGVDNGENTATLTLTNLTNRIAFFVRAQIIVGDKGEEIRRSPTPTTT